MRWYKCKFIAEKMNKKEVKDHLQFFIETKDYAEDEDRAIEQAISYLIEERNLSVVAILDCEEEIENE